MGQFIIQLHSGLRYLILLFLIVAIANSLWAISKKALFKNKDKLLALITLALVHTQTLIGILLYFTSSKVVFSELTMRVKLYRFFTVEHALMMLAAVILITIGFSKAKRAEDNKKHKTIAIFYSIALALILAAIPWNLIG